ncbi:MAG TPA: NAD(P)H-dependent glycerol-3-phosphate dehydrogenase [Acidiphilium sp.]|nr:MAG: glycerol-3-phosphate dehydrogenase [Acidiphilium sp. 21-60-14]OYV91134.1 MAG: glycerol-3-phosphate dehydrogenase [Acidiphilium sp. 37-60-79]HQT87008.1 NAD(P)H-dependent glycerol-3-phosphate dehydrogenase [Acidiphilium sp.]HQU22945.1 NAD(P)H-dependent glycerol-3-phosphate dehydrogenase [Acidiphilium sp.]
MSDRSIAVVGTGAWGTALAIVIGQAAQGRGEAVALVARDAERAAALAASRVNPRLPGVAIPSFVQILDHVPATAQIVLLACPLQHLRAVLTRLPPSDAALVLCCKGVETGTHRLGPEIVASVAPRHPVAVLTGPNFAHEIAANLPAAAVLATRDDHWRAALLARLGTARLRLYGSADPIGCALGGAAKNVIAIAAGAVIGAGLGENARAALITRGLAEISRLAPALGGSAETIAGLAGLGDLILTATGGSSRNYRAGLALGQANAPQSGAAVVEGIATAPSLLARARSCHIEMPITEAVSDLLAGVIDVPAAMTRLLSRSLRDEI